MPALNFITIKGEGAPGSDHFANCLKALYKLSYTIKMTLKKLDEPPYEYTDYAVYPLEGIWDINEEARKNFTGKINKDDFVYTLMIRQPDFVHKSFFEEMREVVKSKTDILLIDELKFERIAEGQCIQMLHVGSFDDEPESFEKMEAFANENSYQRKSKIHREIYLSDFRKVPAERLKTVLRFGV